MATFEQHLSDALATRKRAQKLRTLRSMERLDGARIRIGEQLLIDFSSNDYLGLSRHPHLRARAALWADQFGAGSGASKLVTGFSPQAAQVEEKVAALKGTEGALIFASGWQLNASVLAALVSPDLWDDAKPVVMVDKLIHASLYAGCAQGGTQPIRFRHNDLDHLRELLQKAGSCPKIIVTESVFSMDGDRADLPALVQLAQEHHAILYVDEAHATGVLGPNGAGLTHGLPIDVVMGTFSKALGSFGGYVAGSRALIDYLVNGASGQVYATALPPAVLGAMDAGLDLLPALAPERRRLQTHADKARQAFQAAGLNTGPSSSQIIPVIIGDEAKTLDVQRRLEAEGLLGIAIRPPTVPPGTARLRLSLSAAHSDADIDQLIEAVPRIVLR